MDGLKKVKYRRRKKLRKVRKKEWKTETWKYGVTVAVWKSRGNEISSA